MAAGKAKGRQSAKNKGYYQGTAGRVAARKVAKARKRQLRKAEIAVGKNLGSPNAQKRRAYFERRKLRRANEK